MTYQDWLAHHGIKGMRWGKLNGPPYPLSDAQRSEAERKANPSSKVDNRSSNDIGSSTTGKATGYNATRAKYRIKNVNEIDLKGDKNTDIRSIGTGSAVGTNNRRILSDSEYENYVRWCSGQSKKNLKKYYPDIFNRMKGKKDKRLLTSSEKELVAHYTERQLELSYPSLYEFYYGR